MRSLRFVLPLLMVLMASCASFLNNIVADNIHYDVPDFDGGFIVVSYNVENLYDTINDPEKNDDEFTPTGDRKWTHWRYRQKLIKLWKALAATDLCHFPDIIGLCEVENRTVVENLLYWTPLHKGHYSILHKDSPDRRGIDVALLYNKSNFQLLDSAFIRVAMPNGSTELITRDILYAKGLVTETKDTLHVFLNHWPSKYGGAGLTEPYRCRAAQLLRQRVDSIFAFDKTAKILCMGDFNETPYDEAVMECLNAEQKMDSPEDGKLYDVSYYMSSKRGDWSYWYQGKGELIDLVMVSGNLLKDSGMHILPDNVFTLHHRQLFDNDGKVFRTYQGPVYKGGVSDHLPMVIDINLE